MKVDFFKSASAAENAFRMAVCALALTACVLCAVSELRKAAESDAAAERLSGTAFMTFGSSVPDAYGYREFFEEYVNGSGVQPVSRGER